MPEQRPQSLTFKIYVHVICAAWVVALVACLFGYLSWWWALGAFVAAVALLLAGVFVEYQDVPW